MKKTVSLVLGSFLVGGLMILGTACSPASGNTGKVDSAGAVENFVKTSSTFKFDGFAETLKVSPPLEKPGGTLEFTVEYQTGHPGHGDRSGMILAQMVANHTAKVEVKDGKVTAAVCDGKYDLVNGVDHSPAGGTMPEGQNITPDNPAGMTMPAFDENNLPAGNFTGPELAAK